jgi:TIR domain
VPAPTVDRRYIFLSYKREEVEDAKRVRDALGRAGFRVWWDENVQCGQQWSAEIDRSLQDAGCVVVLWSAAAVRSPWVRHESSKAMALQTYAPCRIELVPIDAPFDQVQASDLTNWGGEDNHPGFVGLQTRVAELLPPVKTRARQFRDWFLAHAMTLAAVAFAVAALLILAWQTASSRKQLSELEALAKTSGNLISNIERLGSRQEAAVAGIERSLYPIDRIAVYVSFKLPIDDPKVAEYRRRIMEGVGLFGASLNSRSTPRPRGMQATSDKRGLRTVRIQPSSQYYPEWGSVEHAVLYISSLRLAFFKPASSPINFEPFSDEVDADLGMEAYPDRDSPEDGLPLVYDVRNETLESVGQLVTDKNDWKVSGSIISLLDLKGSQLFLTFGPEDGDSAIQALRSRFSVRHVHLRIGLQDFFIRPTELTRLQTGDGVTYWRYTFPP